MRNKVLDKESLKFESSGNCEIGERNLALVKKNKITKSSEFRSSVNAKAHATWKTNFGHFSHQRSSRLVSGS